MYIPVNGAEWRRIEDYMNENRDCVDTVHLFDAIVYHSRIYRNPDPFMYDDLTGDSAVEKSVAIAAAQLYCDIPSDF